VFQRTGIIQRNFNLIAGRGTGAGGGKLECYVPSKLRATDSLTPPPQAANSKPIAANTIVMTVNFFILISLQLSLGVDKDRKFRIVF
jgi:hypothetical protein